MPPEISQLSKHDVTAVILAGGRATRMGGVNKGLVRLGDIPMISHVIERLRPQVGQLLISANHDLENYLVFGFEVITDVLTDFPGPLAGIYSAMTCMRTDWLVCVPCDTPRLPADLVSRLMNCDSSHRVRVAHDGIRQQSACCMLHISTREPLLHYIKSGQHAVHRFLAEQNAVQVDFSDEADAFININTKDELHQLE
jgi:molybdopterin-guanine dinucleotide biosynthesis protein A